VAVHARREWLRLKRRRVLPLIALGALLPVLCEGVMAFYGSWGRGLFDDVLEIYFRVLVPFAPGLILAPHLHDELERKTLGLLFVRPAPRGALILAKWLTACGPIAVACALALLGSFTLAMLRFPEDVVGNLAHLGQAELAAVVGVFAFGALALGLGTVLRTHPVIGVLAALVADAGLAALPVTLHLVAPTWHVRNLAGLPLPTTYLVKVDVAAWKSLAGLITLTALVVVATLARVRRAEYVTSS
jgi:hypothetical protein